MTNIDKTPIPDTSGVVNNAFGELSLFEINRNLFQNTDSSTVFRSHFGEAIFEEDRFYVIAGTDSGLLHRYILARGAPKGSRYLFLELPQILTLLKDVNNPPEKETDIFITTAEDWLTRAKAMEIEKYAYMGRLTLLRSQGVLHSHYNDYSPFWREIKKEFDAYTANIDIRINTRPFIICQIANLTENQIPATCLEQTFNGKTAVVLAGGPSLDELLPWVQQHRQNLLVIAASRISHALILAGIQPDISVSIDPQAMNLNISKDMLKFQSGTLLVNNNHLSPKLLASWGGNKVYIGARYPWSTPLEPKHLPGCGGTTVTNFALDIAVKTGVSQIILGGVDFCFDKQGHTHASNSQEHATGLRPHLCQVQVETNSGQMADTSIEYMDAGKHIDSQIKDDIAQNCRVINPSANSMRLLNVEHLSLDDIQVEPLKQPARKIITACIPSTDNKTRTRLYKEELGEVDRVLKELKAINELSSKALEYNNQIHIKEGLPNNPDNTANLIDQSMANKVDRIDAQINTKYANTIQFIKVYDISRFVNTLRLNVTEQLEHLLQNSQIYFQALMDTSKELAIILREARARISSRLEEEKPQPNIQRLLEQWRKDQQPGRAIQWAQLHASYIKQLPEAQQKILHEFQDTYNRSMMISDKLRAMGLKGVAELTRSTAVRAKEYFLCQDEEGLLRLLASLQKHHDQKQATLFVQLVQGYLSELHNKQKEAIEFYQAITEGPIHIDALMRLFELHIKTENINAGLDTLKTLSDMSPTYIPMYADLLQSTGDIDSSVEIYTEYLLAHPDDLDSMMKLGKIFRQCEMAEGVSWTMSYILAREPDNLAAHQLLSEMGLSLEPDSTQS